MKTWMRITLMVMVVVSAAACAKKGEKSGNIAYRGSGYRGGYPQYPQGGGGNIGGVVQGSWGAITSASADMSPVLRDFMMVQDVGFVSGRTNQSTGVFFRGLEQMGSGSLDILVWDEQANQGLEPFFMSFQNVQFQKSGSQVTIIAQDSVGQVIFRGNATSSSFTGTVTYNNTASGGGQGTLGNFSIQTCAILQCQ